MKSSAVKKTQQARSSQAGRRLSIFFKTVSLRLFSVTVACVLLAALPAAAQAQAFWEKKNYKTWTEKECRKMLEDSPWAKTRVIGKAILQELATRTFERARESTPKIEYHIQMRSALPVRQALVRLQMIAAGYDQLGAAQRKAFDAQAGQFLATQFPDSVVIYVEYFTNTPGFARDLVNYWRTRSTGLLQDVQLYSRRTGPMPLVRFAPASDDVGAFQLTFARQFRGEPILNSQDDELLLEFNHATIGDLGAERILLFFKVRDLVLNGKLLY